MAEDINSLLAAEGLRVEYLPVDSLKPYGKNNKKHGQKDLAATFASIKAFGFADVIITDKDYEIIAGHGRLTAAKEAGKTHVPVLVALNLDKTQAKAYRIAHNRTANLSKYNDSVIVEELASLKLDEFPLEDLKPLQLDKWMTSVDLPEFKLEEFKEKEPDELTKEDVPDTLWPSDNDWDVPTLNLKMQADFLDAPVVQWGDVARASVHRGSWHFYTDDSKFDTLWKDPTGPLRSKAITIIEPNFSTGPQFPRASAMGLIFRKRWLARYWQEYGRRIIVDLNIDERLYDICLLGVPKGWRSYATRAMPDYDHALYAQHDLAVDHAGTDDILFVVYAGGQHFRDICKKEGWIHVEDRTIYNRKQWTEKMNAEMRDNIIIKMPNKISQEVSN